MTPAARTTYFRLWRDACAAQGWDPRDAARRREATLYCNYIQCASAPKQHAVKASGS